jgi:hypothetical protein
LGLTGHEPDGSGIRVKDLGNDTYDGGPGLDSVSAGLASTSSVFVDLSTERLKRLSRRGCTSQHRDCLRISLRRHPHRR